METHKVHEELLRREVRIMVVGCGGTGSAILGGLPYLHHYMELEVKGYVKLKERRPH
jgi:hypothetical protein